MNEWKLERREGGQGEHEGNLVKKNKNGFACSLGDYCHDTSHCGIHHIQEVSLHVYGSNPWVGTEVDIFSLINQFTFSADYTLRLITVYPGKCVCKLIDLAWYVLDLEVKFTQYIQPLVLPQ